MVGSCNRGCFMDCQQAHGDSEAGESTKVEKPTVAAIDLYGA